MTADAVTEALRVDLSQSRVLTILEQRYVAEALLRMGRSRDERLTGELAALTRSMVTGREGLQAAPRPD